MLRRARPIAGTKPEWRMDLYRADSSLVEVNWRKGEPCMEDHVVWTGASFRRMGERDIGAQEAYFESTLD